MIIFNSFYIRIEHGLLDFYIYLVMEDINCLGVTFLRSFDSANLARVEAVSQDASGNSHIILFENRGSQYFVPRNICVTDKKDGTWHGFKIEEFRMKLNLKQQTRIL